MSLAIYAAPFENNNSNYKLINGDDNDDYISKKKSAKNKTQKKRSLDEKINPDVLNTIQQIHNTISLNDDDEDNLDDFVPPPPAISAGSERIDMRESLNNDEDNENNINNDNQYSTPYVKQYYNQFLPNKLISQDSIDDRAYPQTLPTNQFSNNIPNNEMVEKMNYMIHLLEDQQAKKTEHVTEEIVLYSFLGIFTIFIVDSFARVGKYVR
jgi:hypothetical protein